MHLYLVLTSFSIAFLSLAMAAALLVRRGIGPRNLVFSLFNLSVFFWSTSYFFWQVTDDRAVALFWCRMLAIGSTFIPVTYLHFISLVTGYRVRAVVAAGYVTALILALLAPTGAVVSTVEPRLMFPFWPVPGNFFGAYLVLFCGYVLLSFILLIRKIRSSNLYVTNQLRYLLWGMLLGFVGGSTNFPLWLDIPLPPVGNGLGILYILGSGYAMIKYRLMELDQMVLRVAVYVCAGFAVSLVGGLFSFYFFQSFGQIYDVSHLFSHWLLAFGVVMVLMWLLPMYQARINHFLDTVLSPGKQGGVDRLRELSKELVGRAGDQDLFHYSVAEIGEAMRADGVAIFFREEIDTHFHLKARHGIPEWGSTAVPASHPFVERLQEAHDPVLEGEIDDDGGPEGPPLLPPSGFEPHDLFFPIRADNTLLGFLALAPYKRRRLHSMAALSLIDTICFQIGLLVRSRHLERRAAQAEKLISLATLAAGLAHELRNPLVSIRTFTGLIGEQGGDPEFRRQFSSVVERDVNRIGAIIDQVAVFANNSDADFAAVDLMQVVRDVQDIGQEELRAGKVSLQIQEIALPRVRGNYSQLIQVFLNLLQNAIHALGHVSAPAIRISFQVKRRKDGRGAVVVVVADNGPGIPAGIRQRVFDPFVTTKNTGSGQRHRGMGLGLGIVKCIVEAHGGAIDLATTNGAGTVFYVELPCSEDNNRPVADPRAAEKRAGTKLLRKKERPTEPQET